jgi:hypothetical protein
MVARGAPDEHTPYAALNGSPETLAQRSRT